MTTGQAPKRRETDEQEKDRNEKMVAQNKEQTERAYRMGMTIKPKISASGRLTSGNN